MTPILDHLTKIAEWQQQYLGRQQMQVAVLKWALEHRESMRAAGLTDSLLAAMETELTVHRAERPQGTP